MNILAVVINYNNASLTRSAVGCLCSQTLRPDILIVDNSSDVLQVMDAGELTAVRVVRTRNRGFGAAVNVGLRIALEKNYDFVWLVNNDTEMPADTLERCLERFQRAGTFSMVSPLLTHSDGEGEHVGSRLHGLMLRSTHVTREEELCESLSWLTAASLFIPAQVIKEVGLFDDSMFFMYWEDADYCARARKAGVKMCIADRCKVLHFGGVTSTLNQEKLFRWHLESFHNFGLKHRIPKLQLYLCILFRWLKWSLAIRKPIRFSLFYRNVDNGAADC